MIELPGSFSGRINSPRPHLGPDDKNLMSFAIFIQETAIVSSAPWKSTIASCVASASNLFFAVLNLRQVITEIYPATFSAKPLYVLSPVPTAVPP